MNKVYKTSILPVGEKMEGIQSNQMQASSHSIEIVHILCFILVILFIFTALWKQAKKLS